MGRTGRDGRWEKKDERPPGFGPDDLMTNEGRKSQEDKRVPLPCRTPKTTGLGNIGADTPQGNVMGLHGDYLPGLENCRVVCVTAEWGPMVQ